MKTLIAVWYENDWKLLGTDAFWIGEPKDIDDLKQVQICAWECAKLTAKFDQFAMVGMWRSMMVEVRNERK